MAEVLVVGAGPGGLAAAARLAAQGHRVTALRPTSTAGWPSAYRRDGFSFDIGAGGLTLPAVYRDLFLKTARRRSGAALEEHVELNALDPAVECRWSDGTTALLPGTNPKRVAAALGAALGGSASADWRAVCARGAVVWAEQRPVPDDHPGAAGRPARHPGEIQRRMMARAWWPRRRRQRPSLAAEGRDLLRDIRLRVLLDDYALRRGVDPADAPASVVAVPFVEQSFGTWHARGGMGALVDAVAERCRSVGVDVWDGVDVRSVTDSDGSVTGVDCVDGSFVPADVVVVDRPPLGAECGTTVLLALRGRTSGLAPATLLLPAGPGGGAPHVRLFAPDDPTTRPAGHEAWSVHLSAPAGEVATEGGADALVDALLGQLAASGLDVSGRLLWSHVVPPAPRPPLPALCRPDVAGLFVVGGAPASSALPYLGLPYAGLDAARVAAELGPA